MKTTALLALVLAASLAPSASNPVPASEQKSFDSLYDALYDDLATTSPSQNQPTAVRAFIIAAEANGLNFDQEQAKRLFLSLTKNARELGTDKEIGRRLYRLLPKNAGEGGYPARTESAQVITTTSSSWFSTLQDTTVPATVKQTAPDHDAQSPARNWKKVEDVTGRGDLVTDATHGLTPFKYTILNVTGGTTNQIVVHSFTTTTETNGFGTLTIQNLYNGQSNQPPLKAQLTNPSNTVIPNLIGVPRVTNFNTFFHSGVFVLNPYAIGDDHRLKEGDTKARAFLELVYNNRWAWDSERFGQAETKQGWLLGRQFSRNSWAGFFGTGYDFQGRISYTFASEDSPSGSSIVGSGDVAAEVNLAKHLWRRHSENGAQSFNLELSYGAVSDRNVFDVHHRGFVGLGYVGSLPEPILNNKRRVQYAVRVGEALIEHVNFVNSTTREVRFENDAPAFAHDWGLGIESEVYYPVLERVLLTAGGRLYGAHSGPNVWSLWIGGTIPLSKIDNLISK